MGSNCIAVVGATVGSATGLLVGKNVRDSAGVVVGDSVAKVVVGLFVGFTVGN